MKISKIFLASFCVLCILPSFGQTEKDKELFEFSTAPAVEAPKVAEVTKTVEKKEEPKKKDESKKKDDAKKE